VYDFGHELYLYWKMYADAGQINLYLNYYRKHEMSEGDTWFYLLNGTGSVEMRAMLIT
jgi:hypothetical protein